MNRLAAPPRRLSLNDFIQRRQIALEPEQREATEQLDAFLLDPEQRVFALRGGPGTGKTLLAGWVARYLRFRVKRPYVLTAPTIYSAAALSLETGEEIRTVHELLYDTESLEAAKPPRGGAPLRFPARSPIFAASRTVFIVDRAEMLDDAYWTGEFHAFGSRRLFADLLRHTRVSEPGRETKLLLLGDDVPWPEAASRILDADHLGNRLRATSFSLPAFSPRRGISSGVQANQARLRKVLASGQPNHFEIDFSKGDVFAVSRPELCLRLAATRQAGRGGVIVTRNEKEALKMNLMARATLWGDEDAPLRAGDRMVVPSHRPFRDLRRGEFVEIEAVSDALESYAVPALPEPLRFRKVSLRRLGPGPSSTVSCLLVEGSPFETGRAAVEASASEALHADFLQRHPGLEKSPDLNRIAANDPYFNAVRLQFGYAVTGPQALDARFEEAGLVFDSGRTDLMAEAFLRWVSAAMSRARRSLYVVDSPRFDPLSYLFQKRGDLTRALPRGTPPPEPLPAAAFLRSVLEKRLGPWGIANPKPPKDDGTTLLYHFEHGLARGTFRFHYDDQGFFRRVELVTADPRFAGVMGMLAGEGTGR